jgi:pimeloyl-ACP methyl ester carboxylesterase
MTSGQRRLDVLLAGPEDGLVCVLHGGTPGAAVPSGPILTAVAAAGMRFVTYSRPGYAASDPDPGRSVADAALDVKAILDHLGVDRFVTLGWSGGGPHALACAALLPDVCLAAATMAGVAPRAADGLDWLAGQGAENQEEWAAALRGDAALTAWLSPMAESLGTVTAGDVAESLGDLVTDVDRESLTGEFAEWSAASFRSAVSTGVAGWRDDDLAFLAPWGFDLSSITTPVTVWQGDQDRMVPVAHGRWLAEHVPGARAQILPGHGHLSIAIGSIDRIVADLAATAG